MSETVAILLEPTTTKLDDRARGSVIVSGSHGGRYPGYAVAKAAVRAIVLNDAGVGLDSAGIGSLAYLEPLGIAAATVSHLSCRIGDADDMMVRGTISHANSVATSVGVEVGQTCREAAQLLRAAPHVISHPEPLGESRTEVRVSDGSRRIVLIDSAALVRKLDDADQIVVTGSHGGLVGGIPAMALQADAFAAVFNDAGVGADAAGITRLPALQARGIAGFTVAASSARIGEAQSTFHNGVISQLNARAAEHGAEIGLRAADVLTAWAGSGVFRR